MKFTIYVNQQKAVDLGIKSINQAHIFDLLTGLSTWAETQIIDGDVFYWVSRQKISEELQLLNLKPDTVYRHLKALSEIQLIEYTKLGVKDCVRLTEKGKSYYVGNKSEQGKPTMSEIDPSFTPNSDLNPSKLGNRSEIHSDLNPTYTTTNNIKLPVISKNKRARTEPTEEEVNQFQTEKGLNLSGFFDYYESNGWMVGKNKMKKWKASARGWSNRQATFGGQRKKNIQDENNEAFDQARVLLFGSKS